MSKLRSRREIVDRCNSLTSVVREALSSLPGGEGKGTVHDAIWQAEGLGTLLWTLTRAELPPYDVAFDVDKLLAVSYNGAALRREAEIERARQTARLWHWRARTSLLEVDEAIALPERWHSFDQLIAASAMRAHEQGFLPRPLRGDFPAFGTGYRELSDAQRDQAHSIAWERHRALNWVCGLGRAWHETPTDT